VTTATLDPPAGRRPTVPGGAPEDRGAGLRFVAVAYGLSRIVTLAGFVLAAAVRPGWSLDRLPRLWDGVWYLSLARHGYPAGLPAVAGRAQAPLAFFPLFPLLIRLVSAVPGVSDGAAGLAVALASGAAAAVALHLFAARLAGPRAARQATVLFCFFPGSIVLSMVYSEGLMIALAAGCLLALERRRWILAGVLGGLATACRPNAVVLFAAAGWAAIAAVRQTHDGGLTDGIDRRRWDVRAMLGPLLTATGVAGFMAFLWLRTGNPGAWMRVQRDVWNQQVDFGRALLTWITWLVQAPFADAERWIVVAGLVFAVAGLRLLVRRGCPAPVTIYTAGILLLAAVYRVDTFRPRAVLAAFPLFMACGDRLPRRAVSVLTALFAVLLFLLPLYYTLPGAGSSAP